MSKKSRPLRLSFFHEESHYSNVNKSSTEAVIRTDSSESKRATRQPTTTFHMTLLHALHHNATKNPNHAFATWLDGHCKVESTLTYIDLLKRAVAVAKELSKKRIQKGDRVMIAYPFGLEFLEGMIGCMLCGAIPCSVYPPNPTEGKAKHSFEQFNSQAKDAGAKYALTTKKFKTVMRTVLLMGHKTRVKWVATDTDGIRRLAKNTILPVKLDLPEPTDVALIQYSSGSTGTPKGIMITHDAIVHNLDTIQTISVAKKDNSTVGVNWMPQYHDYGLFNFYLVAVYSRYFPTINFSPIDFIQNPLLWADALDKFQATHTAAPNFAYGLLAKRMKAAGRTLAHTDKFLRVNIAAEPIAPQTITAMKEIGFPSSAINPTYGLAESCVYVTSCVGSEITILDGVVSCGLLRRNEAHDKYIVITDNNDNFVGEGEVGEINIRGPDLACGYWGKPELNGNFVRKLPDGRHYFGTGDLGKIVDGKLFVVGRQKDLIIINGRNLYPSDVERTIETTYVDFVRPGSTVAFQFDDSKVAIVLELRDSEQLEDSKRFCEDLRKVVYEAHNVNVGRVEVMKKGTVPKTTSGKVRRSETRRRSMMREWKNTDILHREDTKDEPQVDTPAPVPVPTLPLDLPVDRVHRNVFEAIMRIETDESCLDQYFLEFQLDRVPQLKAKWDETDKTTESLRAMCIETISLIEERHPPLVQFSYLLASRSMDDWLQQSNGEWLKDTVHSAFVLNWATKELVDNFDWLKMKIHQEEGEEARLTAGFESKEVPDQIRFLIDGQNTDRLFTAFDDAFAWMKIRSAQKCVKLLVDSVPGKQSLLSEKSADGVDWLSVNVLEAIWVDHHAGRFDNVSVGAWVFARSITHKSRVHEGGLTPFSFEHENLPSAYRLWNMAFSATLPDSAIVLSKLLIPCAMVHDERYFMYRAVSLYLVSQSYCRRKLGTRCQPCVFKPSVAETLAVLTKRWLKQIDTDRSREWTDPSRTPPPTGEIQYFFDKFNRVVYRMGSKTKSHVGLQTEFHVESVCTPKEVIESVLGTSVDLTRTWEQNGLSSLRHAELTDKIAEKFGVTIPPTFATEYPTPQALIDYLEGKTVERFVEELVDLSENQSRNKMKVLPTSMVMIIQSICIGIHFLLLTLSAVPSLLLHRMTQSSLVVTIRAGHEELSWSYLPLTYPLFMIVYSATMIAAKWLVIGRYRQEEIRVYTPYYLLWWFIDRGMDMWELFVGGFIVKTYLGRLFYALMGARIHPSAQLEAPIREFDLVSVGSQTTVDEAIRCRVFGPWTGESPTMRFRPISIGKNASVGGMLCPGVKIGDDCVVKKLSVVLEGSQVPDNSLVSGNPAVKIGYAPAKTAYCASSMVLEIVKVIWLLIEAYIFYGLWSVAMLIWALVLDSCIWRYKPVLYWFSVFWTLQVLSLLVSICLKWLLIGKRSPGYRRTIGTRCADFACDYHFELSLIFLYSISCFSKFWNIILWLHGLDTDMESVVDVWTFPPSKVHLAKIRRSFIAYGLSVDDTEGVERKTNIVGSSIGYRASTAAGIELHYATIRPQVLVSENMYGDSASRRKFSYSQVRCLEIVTILELSVIFWSLVPGFELALLLQRYHHSYVMFFGILAIIVAQMIVWTLLFRLLQVVAVFTSKHIRDNSAYSSYISFGASVPVWCFWWLLWGTPFFGWLLRFMGSKMEGRIVYHGGTALQDYYNLTFADKTVIDDGKAIGHMQVYDKMTFGKTRVAGLLHPGSLVIPGCSLREDQEVTPWRIISTNTTTTRVEWP